MTPQNKLYEAAMAIVAAIMNKQDMFNSFQNLCSVLSTYEQEQPEAIAGEKITYKSALEVAY